MRPLQKALVDISSIRREMARTTQFRGYGPATLAATGAFAILAAIVQSVILKDPANHIQSYLALWTITAVVSAALTGAQMYTRSRRMHSVLSEEMIHLAVEQFLPSVGAGVLLTFVLVRYAAPEVWMLPGLWQIIFSLGIFASCRFLPRTIAAAGIWYMLTGLGCLALAGSQSLSWWTMGVSFGAGQLLCAAILFFATPEAEDEI